jgi:uncharacterized RDD family membrane protein YckC
MASRFLRVFAGITDLLLMLVVLLAGGILLNQFAVTGSPWLTALVIMLGVALLNEIILQALAGSTIGKAVFGISVVRSSGRRCDPLRLTLRFLVKYGFAPGAVWMFFLPDGRAMHDMAVGSVVVQGRPIR